MATAAARGCVRPHVLDDLGISQCLLFCVKEPTSKHPEMCWFIIILGSIAYFVLRRDLIV